jgi:predicted nucleic acid-binding protein
MVPLLDANILLRHLLQDHGELSPRATAYIGRLEAGNAVAEVIEGVVFEVVFTLERSYKQSKPLIAQSLMDILSLATVRVAHPERLRVAFTFYATYNISIIDAYLAATALERERPEVLSLDRALDRIPGLRRIEP